jgi:ATP-dependent RNA helicase DDX18/HAS1
VLAYHEAVNEENRKKHLKWFLLPPTPPSASSSSSGRSGRSSSSSGPSSSSSSSRAGSSGIDSSKPLIMVCTDRTSRGIDSMFCEHVVLFDFPRDPSEYVRRVGRTARGAGGKGVVSLLVLGKQVPLAQEILSRSDKGVPVHRIPEPW